jgi:transposase
MLSMAKKFDVLHSHFIEGKGVKTIARESGLSRTTVRGYVREFAEQKQEIIAGGDKSELLLAMSEARRYHSAGRERTALVPEVVAMIQECLDENDRKKALGQAKLCMKATDIHEYLDEKGVRISYPSVSTCVRDLSMARKEAFIKQEYRPGEVCEFDWGEVRLTIAGRSISYRMAVFTLAASNIRWAALYRTEDTQTFTDAHIRFLRWLESVPYLMVYDNLRVAVAKFVGKTEKEATVALKQLSTYYGFGFRFCNIHKGNEKGHVERSVEFVRRKAFASANTFANEAAAQDRLSQVLVRLNADKHELLTQERTAALPVSPDYSSMVRQKAVVDKFSTVVFKQNHYSVPDYLVGRDVEILAFVEEIAVRRNGRELARHRRSYENHTYTLDLLHYQETLRRKPGALKSSVCLAQANRQLREMHDRFFAANPKEFIRALALLSEYSLAQLAKAVETLNATGARMQADSLKMLLGNHPPPPELPAIQSEIELACEAQLRRYGREAVRV